MVLNEESFLIFAARHYDGRVNHSVEEFYDDLKRFQYLKRLFKKYEESGELRERLILNHLIVIYNCFGEMATPMLFFRLKEFHKYLKPFVVFLKYMPETVSYDNTTIYSSDIPMDANIVGELRKI